MDFPDLDAWKQQQDEILEKIEKSTVEARKKLLETMLHQIQSGFEFMPSDEDDAFNPNHVQLLIDQAADLLERAAGDRHTYEDLAKEYYGALTEALETIYEDEIVRAELKAGKLEIERSFISAEILSIKKQITGSDAVGTKINSVAAHLNTPAAHLNKIRDAAKLGSQPGYHWNDTTNVWNKLRINGSSFGAYHEDKTGELVKGIARYELTTQKRNIAAQAASATKDSDTARAQLSQPLKRYAWEVAAERFEAQRIKNWQKFASLRYEATTRKNGALNFAHRLLALKSQFHQDFRDALARLQKVSEGLDRIYGYPDYELPTPDGNITRPDADFRSASFPPLDPFGPPVELAYFDNCLLWTRKAIHWLIRFSQRDQEMIMPISVREVCYANRTEPFKDQIDSIGNEILFWLAPRQFTGMKHVRLKGISAAVDQIERHRHTVWDISVQVPKSSQIHHREASEANKMMQNLPTVRLGRVLDQVAPQEPLVGGASVLTNASPISEAPFGNAPSFDREKKWRIKVNGKITIRRPQADLAGSDPEVVRSKPRPAPDEPIGGIVHDIILYLHLCYTED